MCAVSEFVSVFLLRMWISGLLMYLLWTRRAVTTLSSSSFTSSSPDTTSSAASRWKQLSWKWELRAVMVFFRVINSYLWQIPVSALVSFVEALEVGYSKNKNPYHNLIHAADVTQTVHYLLLKTGMVVRWNTQTQRDHVRGPWLQWNRSRGQEVRTELM